MEEQGYNGWANKPTWLVSLWFDNDEASYHLIRFVWRNCQGADYPRVAFEDSMSAYLDDINPTEPAGFFADLLGWALAHVEWREIYENIAADIGENGAVS